VTSIGFIGGGKMAEAIVKGLLSSKVVDSNDIRVADPDPARRRYLLENYGIAAEEDNGKAADGSQVVVLAVKPQILPDVVTGIKLRKDQLLVSVAAGITLGFLEKSFPGVAAVRVMPNNPALVQAGISGIAAGKKAGPEQVREVEKIFGAVGEVVRVEEKHMDAVTGLSGSGPAFIYLVIEALAQAGVELGLEVPVAEKLAVQTVLGAGRTMQETGKSAQELREMVTSPGGTTLAGLEVLKNKKFAAVLMEAVRAAAERSRELSR
jgi:pyrroline-5-carboxylate reductase